MEIKKIFNFFDKKELILDIVIVTTITLTTRLLNPNSSSSYFITKFPWPVYIGMMISFFISILIGTLYESYMSIKLPGFVRFLIKVVFFLAATWCFIGPMYFYLTIEDTTFEIVDPITFIISNTTFSLFLPNGSAAISGMILGFSMVRDEIIHIFWMPIFLFTTFLLVDILDVALKGEFKLVIYILLITLTPIIVSWILKKYLSYVRKKAFLKIMDTIRNVIFPFIAGVTLVIWQNATILFMVKAYENNNMEVSISGIFLSLILGGILPIRLLINLSPPWYLSNTIVGVISFLYYIYSLYIWIH